MTTVIYLFFKNLVLLIFGWPVPLLSVHFVSTGRFTLVSELEQINDPINDDVM